MSPDQRLLMVRRCVRLGIVVLATACSDGAGPVLPGDELAYRSLTENGIFLMRADGSDRRRIWSSIGDGSDCHSWSPDGSAITFHTFVGNQIVKVSVATGHEDTLTSGPFKNHCPMWSPDGNRIAFIRVADTMVTGYPLYVMNSDGSNPTRLGTGRFVANRGSWSPDGRWIALTRFSDYQIVLVNAATGELGPPLGVGGGPSWSPDGRRIVFNGQVATGLQVYVMNADGSNVQRLTTNDFNDQYPVWTRDGKLITFHRYQYRSDSTLPQPRLVASLHMIHLDGTPVRWVVGDSAGGDLVVWRPH